MVPEHEGRGVGQTIQPGQSCIIPWITVPDSTKVSTDQNQILLGHVFLLIEDVGPEPAEISMCISCYKNFHK